MTNKFKKCHFLDPKIHLIAIQEIAVSSTAMTHTYWSFPFLIEITSFFGSITFFV